MPKQRHAREGIRLDVFFYRVKFGLAGVLIPILLYADDIVLISDSPPVLQCQLDALQAFSADRDLAVNLGKTKVMVFNNSAAWVTRIDCRLIIGGEVVESV